MIRKPSLCVAAAAGQISVVEFHINDEETDLDALGDDGISPLCAATTWGHVGVVQLLLDASCNPNVRNGDGSSSTALHAAACQEHGKIVHMLLSAGADATLQDGNGRTACDFASISNAVWPLFAARGLTRTPNPSLIAKRVIRGDIEMPRQLAAMEAEVGKCGLGNSSSSTLLRERPESANVRIMQTAALTASSMDECPSALQTFPDHDVLCGVNLIGVEREAAGEHVQPRQPQFSLWRE